MLRFDTAFPGGAGDLVSADDDRLVFEAPTKGCPQPLWFYFELTGESGRWLDVTLRNGVECLGGSSIRLAQPVYRGDDGRWLRARRKDIRYLPETGGLAFRVPLGQGPTRVAHCYPYQAADLTAWLTGLAGRPEVTSGTLCHSAEGRPVPWLAVTDPTATGPKRLVAVIARQHAGETPGSFAGEGLVAAWLGSISWARRLRRETVLLVVPMMDVDGVENGSYGKNQPPVDFNRDWSSEPYHTAVAAVMERLAELSADTPAALFLDLHSPGPGSPSFLVPSRSATSDPAAWRSIWSLGAALEALAPPSCPVRTSDYPPGSLQWEPLLGDSVATEAVTRRFGCAAATLELSYHRSAAGNTIGCGGWSGLGRKLARAIELWLADQAPAGRVALPVPVLDRWAVPQLVAGTALAEETGALVLSPTAATNQATVETKAIEPTSGSNAGAVLRLLYRGSGPTQLSCRFVFLDQHQLRVGPPLGRLVDLEPGVTVRRLGAPVPAGATGWRLLVTARDLTGALRLTLER